MKLNKRFLQFLAAMWILIFHLWIPVSGSPVETFLIRIGYVGVDVFFFLSAYSLADKQLQYGSFLKDRFGRIYLKFILFVVIALIYKKWALARGIKILLGLEFFEKGGGSFLWFLPAIMIFYLLYPLFLKWNTKYKTVMVLILWIAGSLVLEKCFGYNRCFIFTNRIPVILAGYLLKKHEIPKWIPYVCLPIGIVLLYLWGFSPRLGRPWYEFYYVLAIPMVMGLAGISRFVKDFRPITAVGTVTLEIYAYQMIFGSALVTFIYRQTGNKPVTDLLSMILIIVGSIAAAKIYDGIVRMLKKLRKVPQTVA